METKKTIADLRFYKPTKSGKGGTLSIKPLYDGTGLMLQIAPQSGERAFDYDKAVFFKLNGLDVARIVGLIADKVEVDEKGNTPKEGSIAHFDKEKNPNVLGVTYNKEYKTFYFSLAKKKGDTYLRAGCPITKEEAWVMIETLKGFLPIMLGWNQLDLRREYESKGTAGPKANDPMMAALGGAAKDTGDIIEIGEDGEAHPF